MEALHSDEVNDFINRPNFGIFREPPINPYDLRQREKFVKRVTTTSADTYVLREPAVQLSKLPKGEDYETERRMVNSLDKSGMPSQNMTDEFHSMAAAFFGDPNNFGYFKSVDEVAGFKSHYVTFFGEWNGLLRVTPKETLQKMEPPPSGLDVDWRVNRVQLVSLLLHEKPSVYQSDKLPDMEVLSGADIAVRKMNEFERESLEKLRSGEEVVVHATANRIEMLGAIRANASCMNCHDVEEKTMLGAFSYEILREPKFIRGDKIGFAR